MFLYIASGYTRFCLCVFQIAVVESTTTSIQRRDAYLAHCSLSTADRALLRNAPLTDTSLLFPPALLQDITARKRVTTQDAAMSNLASGISFKSTAATRGGQGRGRGTTSASGAFRSNYKSRGGGNQTQRPAYQSTQKAVKRPASSEDGAGDAKQKYDKPPAQQTHR